MRPDLGKRQAIAITHRQKNQYPDTLELLLRNSITSFFINFLRLEKGNCLTNRLDLDFDFSQLVAVRDVLLTRFDVILKGLELINFDVLEVVEKLT